MLTAVADTSVDTLQLVGAMRDLMASYKLRIGTYIIAKSILQDLLNTLFRHPYTRIDFIQRELQVTRQTAARYLDELAEAKLISKHQAWKEQLLHQRPAGGTVPRGSSDSGNEHPSRAPRQLYRRN